MPAGTGSNPGAAAPGGQWIDERPVRSGALPGGAAAQAPGTGPGGGAPGGGDGRRLVREKGFVEYFEMAGRIAREWPQARFLVVGITERDQSDAIDPRALIAAHALEGRCVVLEQRRDMPELYLCMDLAVLPSYREGIRGRCWKRRPWGCRSRPASIRGRREVILEGQSGRLFPSGMDTASPGWSGSSGDPVARRHLGEGGRQRVLRTYTETLTGQRLEELLPGVFAG